MLRTILIVILLLIGWGFAFSSPLYAACLYLWIAYFRPEAWAWNPVFATLNLSYFAGVFLLIRTAMSGKRFQLTFRSTLLLIFLGHAVLSSVLGVDPSYSFNYLELFAKTIIVSLILTFLVQEVAELRLVLVVIALSLGLEAAKQGWAQLLLNPGARNDNTIPFLGDNNLVAVGMAMLMPILGALASTSKAWQKRGFQFLSIGVVYRGLSTFSRGGLLSFIGVGALQLLRSRRKFRAIVGIAIVVALIVPALPDEYWDRMGSINAAPEQRDDSSQSRLYFWGLAIRIANDHPLLGVGHSAFPRAFNLYDTTGGLYGRDRAVHSAWFGVLSELGYPGLLLFIFIIATSLLACRRVRKSALRGETAEELGAYATGLESSLLAFLIGGSFVSFHYSEMLWHFFGLTMVLETVAANETARKLAAVQQPPPPTAVPMAPKDHEPEFVWG